MSIRSRKHRPWPVRAFKWLLLISAIAMGVAASTSQSDVGIRADGTKPAD